MTIVPRTRYRLLAYVAALLVGLLVVLAGNVHPASAATGPENRVRASSEISQPLVGPPQRVSAGQHQGIGQVSRVLVVATGVAAKTVGETCNSFTGLTLVLMADGTRKPIKDVKLGDWVMAKNPITGLATPRKVIDLIRHSGPHTMVKVRLADGTVIDATDHHPFWVKTDGVNGRWVNAIDLAFGDTLITSAGATEKVASVSVSEQDLTAYNLTVDDLHTYYVGDDEVLVHNASGCIPWSSGTVSSAARSLDQGATSVTVKSRSEAEELFLGRYQGEGYQNASGSDGVGTKQLFGTKRGTYHWDDQLGEDGRVLGHGASNADGDLPHLQIHTFNGPIIRIFWEP